MQNLRQYSGRIGRITGMSALPPAYKRHKEELKMSGLILRKLPLGSNHDEVLDVLSIFGRVSRIELMYSRGKEFTGECIAHLDVDGAKKAVDALNNKIIQGKLVEVEFLKGDLIDDSKGRKRSKVKIS